MVKGAMHGEMASSKEFFDRSTRLLTEEHSGYKPVDGVFTAAQVVAHVAQTVEWFFQGAFDANGFSMDFEGMDREARAVTSLAAARAWLDKAYALAHQTIDAHTDEEWLSPLPEGPIMGGLPRLSIGGAIVDHSAHHRGALTVYARLLGITPPMPYMEM